MPPDSHGRLVRQSVVILTFGWLLAPLQFLTSVIVAREIGPGGKGVLALLTGLTAILVSIVGLGIPTGASALYRRSGAEVVATAFAVTAITASLLLVVQYFGGMALVTLILSERDLAALERQWILLAVIAVVPLALGAVADVVLIAADAMRMYSLRAAVTGLLGVAITWVLTVWLDWGLTGALVSYPTSAAFGLVLFAVWWRKQDSFGLPRPTLACARALLHVGMQQHAIAIIALVAKRVDVFLVASMLGLRDAGFYAAGILIPQVLIGIPRATMWPLVSALSAQEGRVSESITRITRLQVAFMAVVSAMLVPLTPVLVRWIFGETFGPAEGPFRWALVGLAFTPLTITVNAVMTSRAKPGLSIGPSLAGTSIQIATALLLMPRWGASGAAAALSANFAATAVLQLAVAHRQGMNVKSMLVPVPQDLALVARALRARI